MKNRDQIEEKYKWDLSSYYKDDEAWQEDFKKIKQLNDKLCTYEGKFDDDEILLEMLNLNEQVGLIEDKLAVYISLRCEEDSANAHYKNMSNKLEKYFADVEPNLSFIFSDLHEISDKRLRRLTQDSRFANYDLLFKDIIKSKPHKLSKEEEKLLANLSESIGGQNEVFGMLNNVDIKFEDAIDSNGKKHTLTNTSFSTLASDKDRVLRKSAVQNLNAEFGKLNYTICTNYLNHIKVDCTFAKIRKFKSAFDSAFFGEDVDTQVYFSLVKNVRKFIPILYRYFELKRKALGLNDFASYDIYANISEVNEKKYTYDEAIQIIKDATKILGKDYIDILQKAKDERWIDVMPNKNKNSGAFETDTYSANPVVLINYNSTQNDISTLAHEMGHMMHSYYSNKSNPSTKAQYTIFVAEVASTVNELLLANHMLKSSKTAQEKIAQLDQLMQLCYGTIFHQTLFAEFEKYVHDAYENNEELTTQSVNAKYTQLLHEYLGENVYILPELSYGWSRVPHFYRSFYVYKYATALISALAIANNILNGKHNAVKNYKEFLCSGRTKPPVELLKIAGVDLTSEQTFEDAFNYMQTLLDEWECTTSKI